MSEKVEPNPPSPYATADAQWRHTFPLLFGIAPPPCTLAVTACGEMAVTPDEPLQDVWNETGVFPPGICPDCTREMQGANFEPSTRPQTRPCADCGLLTTHDGLCALCRQQKHDEWKAAQTDG